MRSRQQLAAADQKCSPRSGASTAIGHRRRHRKRLTEKTGSLPAQIHGPLLATESTAVESVHPGIRLPPHQYPLLLPKSNVTGFPFIRGSVDVVWV